MDVYYLGEVNDFLWIKIYFSLSVDGFYLKYCF